MWEIVHLVVFHYKYREMVVGDCFTEATWHIVISAYKVNKIILSSPFMSFLFVLPRSEYEL